MATNAPKVLYRNAVPTSTTTLYTAPALGSAVVTNIVLSNTSSSPVNVTVNLDTIAIVPNIAIAAGGIYTMDIRQALNANGTLSAIASATGLNIHASGMEITN